MSTNGAEADSRAGNAPTTSRLVSLDAFRGLTVAGMILVNNPGSWSHVYPPLRHAEWHGFTPTDLVFPAFLFIAGVAIPLSLDKRIARGEPLSSLLTRIGRRTVLIFFLGLLLNAFPFDKSLATLRIPGVLQRIAVCYGIAATLYATTRPRTRILAVVALLLGYWGALTLITVPEIGAGDLSRPGNLPAWVDRCLLPGHLYKSDYDPEGVLSTLPAIATAILGSLAGRWLTSRTRPPAESAAGLFAAGVALFWAGWAWGQVFPINKALWTSSFTLFTAGLTLQGLALCVWLIDHLGIKGWSWPFLMLGSNALAAYVLSGLGARMLAMIKIAPDGGTPVTLKAYLFDQAATFVDPTLASLILAVSYVAVWVLVTAVLHRARLFIRL